jgi:hypothetical protein
MDTNEPKPSQARPSSRRVRYVVVLLLLLVPALVLAGGFWWRTRGKDTPVSDDPRLTYETRYRNVRPDVKYVGDGECAACHKGHCDSFHQHPMGQSVAPPINPPDGDHLDRHGRASFEAFGLGYVAERRGDRLFHKEIVTGPDGGVVASVENEVRLVLGSGRRGKGYLVEEDGYVFQSPISWYTQKGIWDLSPGYQQSNAHFDRAVIAKCLFCHCNQVEPIERTINRYRGSIAQATAIGCERCHGPGELHVRRQQDGEGMPDDGDDTIVNPRRLAPDLREAVCEQCHLQGQARVVKRGREEFDFRPGLPLRLFWAVFIYPPESGPDRKAVGQVEQMRLSRCFQESKGSLGCASCHDPHALPSEEKKIAFYRDRCMTCHKDRGCSAPAAAQREQNDNCVACHMHRSGTSDIPHVASTDHRILRDPDHSQNNTRADGLEPEVQMVDFYREQAVSGEKVSSRDLGVSLMELALSIQPGAGRRRLGETATPLLREATRADPEDLAAWEKLGYALRCEERNSEALSAYQEVLAAAPTRELALAEAATIAAKLQLLELSMDYWKRAVAVNPRRAHYRTELAKLLLNKGQWQESLDECDAALRLSPASVNTRVIQVECLLKSGRKEEARAAFAKLMALKPQGEDDLRRWFEKQPH